MFYQCILKLKTLIVLTFLLFSLTLEALPCSAEKDSFDQLCFSVGLGLGVTKFSGFNDDNATWKLDDIGSTSMEVFGGYHFLPRWFAEVSYSQFGSMDLVNPYASEKQFADVSFSGLSLKGGYYLPISWLGFGRIASSDFQPFVKVGIASVSNSTSDNRVKLDEGTAIKPQLALGVDWAFSNDWQARAQWESTSELASVAQLGMSYVFSFDRALQKSPTSKPISIDENEYVALMPGTASAKRHKNKSTFERVYFAEGSTALEASAQVIIDKIKAILTQYPYLHIVIMDAELSHNSTLGFKQLSRQRAKKLQQKLIASGISSTRINKQGLLSTVQENYQAADFFGRQISVKTLVLAPLENNTWALFNR